MKKLVTLLIILFISVSSIAQNLTIDQPRMRVNKTSSLLLDNNWKTIEFDGTSTDNVNTFGNDPTNNLPWVRWDQTNKLLGLGETTIGTLLCRYFQPQQLQHFH